MKRDPMTILLAYEAGRLIRRTHKVTGMPKPGPRVQIIRKDLLGHQFNFDDYDYEVVKPRHEMWIVWDKVDDVPSYATGLFSSASVCAGTVNQLNDHAQMDRYAPRQVKSSVRP